MTIKSGRDWPTSILWIATATSIVVAFFILWGAGLFRPGGRFLHLAEIENVGSFLSGVFTPLAILWAARTFVLQRQQMLETLAAMREQLEIDRESIINQREQSERERQRELEMTDPLLQVRHEGLSVGPIGATAIFSILNLRSVALRTKISYVFQNKSSGERIEQSQTLFRSLEQGESAELNVPFPSHESARPSDYDVTFTLLAERADRLISEFVFGACGSFNVVRTAYRPAEPGLRLD